MHEHTCIHKRQKVTLSSLPAFSQLEISELYVITFGGTPSAIIRCNNSCATSHSLPRPNSVCTCVFALAYRVLLCQFCLKRCLSCTLHVFLRLLIMYFAYVFALAYHVLYMPCLSCTFVSILFEKMHWNDSLRIVDFLQVAGRLVCQA